MKTDKEKLGLNGSVKMIQYFDDDNFSILNRIVIYDVKGNIIEENIDDGYLRKITTYNEVGKKIKTEHYGRYRRYSSITLDKVIGAVKGLSLKKEKNNLLAGWEEYIYSFKEELSESVTYSFKGEIISKKVYNYDSYNNLIEDIIYNQDSKIKSQNLYKYSENRKVIEFRCINYLDDEVGGGCFDLRNIIIYDSNWNEIGQEQYRGEKLLRTIKYTYEYDKVGNWVKQVNHIIENETGEEVDLVNQRKIIYY